MVPIHDTDIAEDRWSKAEWEHYELWERVEVRLRRRKQIWIFGTVLVFLALSSIPIFIERWPKWRALSLARLLAQEVNGLKREAAIEHMAYRIEFLYPDSLEFKVQKAPSCVSRSGWGVVRTGNLIRRGSINPGYSILDSEQGEKLGLPGLTREFCYDPIQGGEEKDSVSGFGVISAKDLTEGRADRVSLVLISGPFAEPSFE